MHVISMITILMHHIVRGSITLLYNRWDVNSCLRVTHSVNEHRYSMNNHDFTFIACTACWFVKVVWMSSQEVVKSVQYQTSWLNWNLFPKFSQQLVMVLTYLIIIIWSLPLILLANYWKPDVTRVLPVLYGLYRYRCWMLFVSSA